MVRGRERGLFINGGELSMGRCFKKGGGKRWRGTDLTCWVGVE